ncbi:MAG: hypothetical protein J6C90_01495, partial [Clostridia bacterium]|nr:hypothetical protein [Clostridia bacterium]
MSGLLSLGLGSLSAVSFLSDPLGFILWGICKILFNALSGLENVFRALTGMSPTAGIGGESGDVIVEVLQSDVTRNIMFSLTLFGVCVLVLTIILAIIRNVYKDDSKVTISSIFGQAIKAVMGFILIPALCIVGVLFSNVILKAIDGATKNSEARSSSFVYGIINATSTDDGSNVFRDNATPSDDGELTETQQALIVYCNYLYRKGASIMGIKDRVDEVINKDKGINTLEEMIAYYEVVSELFLDNFPDWKEDGKNFFGGQKWKQIDIELKYSKGGFLGIGSTTYYFADDKYD